MIWAIVFLFGTVVGSFLNVCIARLPTGESIVAPASRCPACRTPIQPWDNVPLLSYLWLRGRCRACGVRIPFRYPLVELTGGAAALAVYATYGLTPLAAIRFAFLAALIVVTFIDLDHQIIPDAVSLPGIGVGLVSAVMVGEPPWQDSLFGLLLGGAILWVVAEGYYRLTGREGMGGGDVKLLAMIGAFLGWRAVPITILVGSLVGSVVGGAIVLARRGDSRTPIPFGPFLALGAAVALFFQDPILRWYLSGT